MVDPSWIDKDLGTTRFPVEGSKVREFARALDDRDPVYTDADAARAAGFDAVPVPPTFVVSAMHWRDEDEDELGGALGLDMRRVLHGECGWEYHGPIIVGDELTATRRICNVENRQGRRGGAMTLVTTETDVTNQRGELVVRQTDVFIETGS